MFRYRPRVRPADENATLSLDEVRRAIAAALLPAHFFVGPELSLEWEHVSAEETPWEIFQGRLLERAQTRERRCFEAWNVYAVEAGRCSDEPLLAVKLDAAAGMAYVTRALLSYAWEGYHAGDNVYLSRETTRWVRELVGTVTLADYTDPDDLLDELAGRLFQAVVGLSRLPLTSVEAPLPDFSLGRFAYFHRPHQGESAPMRSWRDLLAGALHGKLSDQERVKVLEAVQRAMPAGELKEAGKLFVERWHEVGRGRASLPGLLRALFNEVSLSPWTDFTAKALRFAAFLVESSHLTEAQHADFLAYLLRQLGRHLTAYDLVTFHHRGANYPDALLLDEALKAYLALIESHPDLFAGESGRLRRRALRQGWLLRRHYEGHPVPDAPTSPGENARVLPPAHRRVPDEQITQPGKRTRRLYAGDPLSTQLGEQGRRVLRESVADLRHPTELRELGMAVFIERPLGAFKAPAEPDQTVLLSCEAFSRAIARRRLEQLARDECCGLDPADAENARRALADLAVCGLSLDAVGRDARPVVALADARKAADDFVLLRTLPAGVREFLRPYERDIGALRARFSLDYLTSDEPVLIVRGVSAQRTVLNVHDGQLRRRLELEIDGRGGYLSRGGVEVPRGGLRVLRVWEPTAAGGLREIDVSGEGLFLGRGQ